MTSHTSSNPAAPGDLDLLKRGPLYMLAHVAGADWHVDSAEWSALIDTVVEAANADDELVRSVMGALSVDLHEERAPLPDDREPLEGLKTIAEHLDRRADKGRSLREALLEIGATVAEASGAQLTRTFKEHHGQDGWVRSAGTSAMERAALSSAAEALGLGD